MKEKTAFLQSDDCEILCHSILFNINRSSLYLVPVLQMNWKADRHKT